MFKVTYQKPGLLLIVNSQISVSASRIPFRETIMKLIMPLSVGIMYACLCMEQCERIPLRTVWLILSFKWPYVCNLWFKILMETFVWKIIKISIYPANKLLPNVSAASIIRLIAGHTCMGLFQAGAYGEPWGEPEESLANDRKVFPCHH